MRKRNRRALQSGRVAPIIESLEPRIMFSADFPGLDAALPDADPLDQVDAHQVLANAADAFARVDADNDTDLLPQGLQAGDAPGDATATVPIRHELVIIDPGVGAFEQLLADLRAGSDDSVQMEVVVLDDATGGIAQLSDVLAQYHDLDSIHLISHGADGAIVLAGDVIDLARLRAETDTFSAWGGALATDGDILVYGCDVASTPEGEALIDALAAVTQADVAASDDLTGNASLGGDWDLEYRSGDIDAAPVVGDAAQTDWRGTLAADVLTGSWAGTGSATGPFSSVTSSTNPVGVTMSFALPAGTGVQNPSNQTMTSSAFFSNSDVQGASSLYAEILWDTTPETPGSTPASGDAGTITITFTFDRAVVDPILHVDKLGGYDGSKSNSSLWTVTTPGATLTKLAGVGHLDVTGTTFQRTPGLTTTSNTEASADSATGTAAGSIRVNGTYTTLTFTFDASGNEGAGGDGLELLWELVAENPYITSNGGGATASVNVNEGVTAVTTVAASDTQSDPVSYSIAGGLDASRFDINSSTGALTFKSAPNYESPTDSNSDNVYVVTVQASDGTYTDTQTISVHVQDVNEAPGGAGSLSTTTLNDNAGATALFGGLSVTDPDAGENDLTLRITLSDPTAGVISGGGFAETAPGSGIYTVSGLTVAQADTALDNARFTPTDNTGSSGSFNTDIAVDVDDGTAGYQPVLSATTVTINRINDAPSITSGNSVNAAENQTGVMTVTATDPDSGDTPTFTLSGGADQGLFSITAGGVLTFNAARDFETFTDANSDGVYEVQVTASDGNGGTDVQLISVTVTDVNETPTDITPNGFSVNENVDTSGGHSLGSLSTTDQDGGDTFSYAIVGGADQAKFSIGGAGLDELILTDGILDYETQSSYQVTVRTTDSGGLWYEETLTVTVNDLNEAPGGAGSLSTTTLNDNAGATALFGGLSVTDPDAGENDLTLRITLSDPTAGVISGGGFAETAPGSGIYTVSGLTVAQADTALDNARFTPTDDTGSSGSFNTDIAVDVDDGMAGYQPVLSATTVTINRINDAPQFDSAAVTAVNEDSAYSYNIVTSDPDTGAVLTINATTLPAWLTLIDNGDGTATLSGTPTNAEVGDHSVVLEVSDGSLTDTQGFTITVSNTNDAPVITSDGGGATAAANVAENTSTVTTVSAADVDVGDMLTYSISGGPDAARFNIDANSGALTFTAAPDYENPTDSDTDNVYEVTVQVSDGNGGMDWQDISVTVTQVNEAPTDTSYVDADTQQGYELDMPGGNLALAAFAGPELDSRTVFSVEMKVNFDSIAASGWEGDLVAQTSAWDQDGFFLNIFDNKITYAQWSGGAQQANVTTSAGVLTTGEHWVALVVNNGSIGIYIDGVSVASGFSSAPIVNGAGDLGFLNSIDGQAQEIRVWSTARSQTDIQNNLGTDYDGSEAGLMALYEFTDGTGVTVSDATANSYDLTITDPASSWASTGYVSITATVESVDDDSGDTLTYSLLDDASGKFSIDANSGVITWNGVDADLAVPATYDITVRTTDSTSLTYDENLSVTTGTDGANSLSADNTRDSLLYGLGGDDTLSSGAKNDFIYGGDGDDTAVFTGNASDYIRTYDAATGQTIVVDTRVGSPDGTDRLLGVENLQFADQTLAVGAITVSVPSSADVDTNTTYAFNAGTSNAVAVSGDTSKPMQVTLSVTNGSLTLSGTTGLSFSAGDGTADAGMTFTGTLADVNAALDGLAFDPTPGYGGAATLTLTATDATYADLNTSADQEAHYSFDNTSALGADDSGNGNTGVVVGATDATDAERGQVIDFDGSNDYVQVSGMFGNPSQITLAAWIKVDATETKGHLISLGDNVGLSLETFDGSAYLHGYFYDGSTWLGTTYSETSLAGDGWHHVAFTLDEATDTQTLYLDGVAVSQTNNTQSISWALGTDTYVGKHGNGDTQWDYSGLMDDARIYTRALTASELQSLALATPTDTGSIAITVNSAPTITSDGGGANAAVNAAENQTAVTTVTASDADGDTPTFTLSGGADQGLFSITAGGVLTFNAARDFETFTDANSDGVYEVQITADDGNGGTDVQLISVTVIDVNEAPGGAGSLSTTTLNDNAGATALFGGLSVTDPDAGENDLTLRITLSDPTAGVISGGGFAETAPGSGIYTVSGLTVAQADTALDNARFTPTDNTGSSGSFNTDIAVDVDDGSAGYQPVLSATTVTINRINDAPQFDSAAVTAVNEDSAYSYNIVTSDPDTGAVLTINATTLPAWLTLIDNGDGTATLSGTPTNAEVGDHSVVLEVSDGSLTDTQGFTITVSNTNDAPSITSGNAVNAAENQTGVMTVTATDPDSGDTPTFTLSGGADQGLFSITAGGVLTFNAARDFETFTDANSDGVYEVQVTADDGNGGTDVQLISVTVTDANETPTDITPNGFSVNENVDTSGGHSLGGLSTTDQDSGDTFSYAIVGGADAAVFSIGGAGSDELILTDGILDYETQSSYQVTVRTTDSGGLWYEETLTVTVNDLNEAPGGAGSLSTTTLNDNAGATALFGGLSVTDPDAGENDLTLRITLSDPTAGVISGGGFAETAPGSGIYTVSGLTVAQADTALDNARFTPTDNTGSSGSFNTDIAVDVDDGTAGYQPVLSATTVTINRINDAPQFDSAAVTAVNEDSAYSYNIVTSDPDTGAVLTINATTLPAWLTLIDNGDGTATLSGTPTNAEVGDHSVVLEVSDGSLTDTQGFTITVSNTNDAPSITSGNAVNAAENQTGVMTVTATDPDSGDTPTFSISGGADGGLFSITAGGVLTFNAARDFETFTDANSDGVYEVQVTADDGNGGTDVQLISVTVTDVNETPTDITPNGFSVNENVDTSGGHSLGSLSTTDQDGGDTFSYAIVGGADQAKFSIGGAGLDELILTDGILDYETQSSYQVTVRTTDSGGLWYEETLTVTVNDLNDAPSITSSNSVNAAENQTGVMTVTATDPDSGDTPTFTLSGGADQGLFSITAGGVLTFNAARDFETFTDANSDGVYEVQVTADDGNGGTDVQLISVTVTDVNETPTDITPNGFSVNENVDTSGGHSLGSLSTTDQDGGDTFSYAIVGGADQAKFSIGGAGLDELILTDGILDYETQSSYQVTVRTTDSGGLWYEETLTVTVNDLNDAPSITSSNSVNAAENQTGVMTVTATDPDSGDTPTFTLSGGADQGLFSITAGGVLTFNAARDFETFTDANSDGVYEVQVTADDGNGGTDVQLISVTVTDVNETPTDITPNGFSVNENVDTSGGHSLGSLSTTDQDGGDTFSYAIVGGADQAKFSIGGAGLDELILTDGILDYETQSSYQVTVRTTDSGGLWYEETLTVTVNDLNDAPSITSSNSVNAAENQTGVMTVTATDPDSGDTPTFTLSGGADQGLFSITAGGVLTFNAARDFETFTDANSDGVYEVQVTADDGNGGTDVQLISVTVTDVNETPTDITPNGFSVNENVDTSGGHSLGSLSTTDQDGGDTFSYAIVGGADQAKFSIGGAGLDELILTDGILDYETQSSYQVTVRTTDSGGLWYEETLTVTVNDLNEAPGGAGSLSTTTLNDNAGATALFGGLSVTDPDAGENDLTLRITLSDPTAGVISGGGFAETAPGSGIYTVSGLTVAQADTALDNARFTPTDNTGSSGSFNTDIAVDVDDGMAGYQPVLSATTVTINRVNDAPSITSGNAVNAAENQTGVMTVTATDDDIADTPTFSISGGADGGLFSITAGGVLTFNAARDFETFTDANSDGVYEVQVTADDGNGGTDVQLISVTVTDANETPTDITPNGFSVNENVDTSGGHSLGGLSTTDQDSGDTFSYAIVGGADAAVFSIGGAGSDELILTDGILDYETQSSYQVTVRTTDSGGLWYEETLTVTVNDLNEAPGGAGSLSTTTLNDNAGATALFGGLSVTDPDAGENDLTLRITLSDPTAGVISGGGFAETAPGSGIYTVSGLTVAQADTALDNARFTPTDNTGSSGSFNTDIAVDVDDGMAGYQPVLSATTVTINRVNDPAVVGGATSGTVTEDVDPDNDTLLAIAGVLNSVDPDAGDIGFQAASINGTYGQLTIDAAGNWQYAADNTQAAIQQLDAGENLVDNFTVSTADGTTQGLTITLDGAEDAPVLGGTTSGAVAVDGAQTASGNLTISDADTSDNPIGFADVGSVAGDNGYGSFVLTSQNWTYQLDAMNATVQALHVGQSLTDTHTFVASDGSTQQVSVTIAGPATASPAPEPEPPDPVTPVPPVVDPPVIDPDDEPGDEGDEPEARVPGTGFPEVVPEPAPRFVVLPDGEPIPIDPDDLLLSVTSPRDRAQPAPTTSVEDTRSFLQGLQSIWLAQREADDGQSPLIDGHSQAFWDDLERMINEIDQDAEKVEGSERLSAEAAAGFSLSLTAGFVSWALRAGSMAASFLAAMPAWRNFDPMPVLAADDQKKRANTHDDGDAEDRDQEAVDENSVDAMFDR
ncbi:MAG: cadherin domain-containing protein [Chromatiaceae bacterium]|nr:cadherin domain-containing protein [Chromatiaceae bacterium]